MESQNSLPCQSLVKQERCNLDNQVGQPDCAAQQILTEIAEDIRTLRKDKTTLENLLESRTQEVKSYKDRVACYQREYERTQETLISVQKRLVEKEDFNKIRNVKIENLEKKLKETESNLLTTRQFSQEIIRKHNKLREFLALLATDLQIVSILLGISKSNASNQGTAGGETPHGKLAAMGKLLNDKFTKLESNRQGLQETARKNQHTALAVLDILQKLMQNISTSKPINPKGNLCNETESRKLVKKNKIRKRIIWCNLCGKRMSSRQKLLEHRKIIHIVQKAKKLVQQKNVSKRKLALKKTQQDGQLNSVPSTTHVQEAGNSDLGSNSLNSTPYEENNEQNNIQNLAAVLRDPPAEEKGANPPDADLWQYIQHTEDISDEGIFCTCGKEFTTTHSLTLHVGYYRSRLFQRFPEISFPDYNYLNDHMKQQSIDCCVPSETADNTNLPNLDHASGATSSGSSLAEPQNSDTTEKSPAKAKHEVDRSRQDGFYCVCGNRFGNKRTLAAHIKFLTLRRDFKCPHCPNRYLYFSQLKVHLLKVHQRLYPTGSQNLACPPSHVAPIFSSLRTPTAFIKHGSHTFQGSEGPDVLLCRCGTKFGNWDTLNAHIRFYTTHRSFACGFCKEGFIRLWEANEHLEKIHKVQVDPNHVGCETCGVVFANMAEYSRHMIITSNENETSCPRFICPMKIFTQESRNIEAFSSRETQTSQTIASAATSNKVEPEPIPKTNFSCQVCGKRFLFSSAFRLHMDTAHKLLKSFGSSCKACGRFFVSDVDFYNHTCTSHVETREQSQNTQIPSPNIPTGMIDRVDNNLAWKQGQTHKPVPLKNPQAKEPEYRCTCGRVFNTEYSRKLHIRTRAIGRIFVCFWCLARFHTYPILKNHVKVCHPGCVDQMKKHACNICAKPFSTRPEMHVHKAMEHSNVKPII